MCPTTLLCAISYVIACSLFNFPIITTLSPSSNTAITLLKLPCCFDKKFGKFGKIFPLFSVILYPWYRSITTSFLHVWCHAVFCVSNAKISCGNLYFHETRRDVAMRQDVTLPRDEMWYLHETES